MVLIAALTALGVVGRVLFYMIPAFKPVGAIAIIAGMILYHLTIDDAMYKEGDWGSVPYAFLQYSLDVNIAKDGKI